MDEVFPLSEVANWGGLFIINCEHHYCSQFTGQHPVS